MTVRGPVKKPPPDGMSRRGGAGAGAGAGVAATTSIALETKWSGGRRCARALRWAVGGRLSLRPRPPRHRLHRRRIAMPAPSPEYDKGMADQDLPRMFLDFGELEVLRCGQYLNSFRDLSLGAALAHVYPTEILDHANSRKVWPGGSPEETGRGERVTGRGARVIDGGGGGGA